MNRKENEALFLWLENGVWALALAGIHSVVLVVLRTPGLASLSPDKSIFKSSLAVHVNLSVLVWMFSIICVIWSHGNKRPLFESFFYRLAFCGMALMAIAPLVGDNSVVMNNYVPIVENLWFIAGLALFGCATLCFSITVFINGCLDFSNKAQAARMLLIVKISSSLMYVMVWACFILSYREIIALSSVLPMDIEYYYEMLFWSGGHLIQFIYVQAVMLVWLALAETALRKKLGFYRVYNCLFMINFVLAMFVFYGHLMYQLPEYEFKEFFTAHMRYCGGVAPLMFIIILIADIVKSRREKASGQNPPFILTALLSSILMFFAGGLIGILISGVNLSIPAHYHGAIVGISIAFLGFAYIFCFRDAIFFPVAGRVAGISSELFARPEEPSPSQLVEQNLPNFKWPNIQLLLITIGQLLHISGLALAGGYGVLRKTPDGAVPPLAKIYMGMLGGGGLIAISGGLIFVYICAKRLYTLRILKKY